MHARAYCHANLGIIKRNTRINYNETADYALKSVNRQSYQNFRPRLRNYTVATFK